MGVTWSFSTDEMAKRGCGAPSAGKPWTIISMETARTNSRYSERTASTSSRRYGGNILLATLNWMDQFSFTRTIYLTRNNLRKLHSQQSRMEEARKEYEEAPKIDRELAQKNPESYLPHLATRLKNLRKLDSDLKSAYR